MRPVFGILLLAVGAVAARDRQSLENILSIPLVPHAVHQRRIMAEQGWIPEEVVLDRPRHYPRRLASANDPTPVSELFQGYGTHYADLWVGAPPQRQTVIVDTGSGTTAFPCSGCQNCGVPKYHSDGLFMEDMSETFEALTCHNCFQGDCRSGKCSLSRFYLEGSSWSAYEAQDRCYIGGMHSSTTQDDHGTDSLDPFHAPAFGFDLKFGCQTHLKGMFEKQVRTSCIMIEPYCTKIRAHTCSSSLLMVSWEWTMTKGPTGSRCTRPALSLARHFRCATVGTIKSPDKVPSRVP